MYNEDLQRKREENKHMIFESSLQLKYSPKEFEDNIIIDLFDILKKKHKKFSLINP